VEPLVSGGFPHVHTDHTLELALRRIAEAQVRELPVISREDARQVLGVISVEDILAAYRGAMAEPAHQAETSVAVPTRLMLRAGAAVLAVALVGGLLNYYYRGEGAARARQYFAAGNRFAAANRNDEAIEQYRTALSISHSTEHRLALGLALLKAGRHAESAIYLKQVARERPDSAPVHAALGQAEFALGDFAAARQSFLRAVRIDPADGTSGARAALCEQKLQEARQQGR